MTNTYIYMHTSTNRFAYGTKIILYALAGILPVWFLPLPFGVEFGRELTFIILIAAGALAWLVSLLVSGEIRYPHSPILYAALALIAVLGVSTLLSRAPYFSAFLADSAAERWAALGIGLALMAATAAGLRSRGEAGTVLFVLIFAGAAAALASALSLLGLIGPIGPIGPVFSVVGTANGLALFYAALLMMTAGLLLSPAAHAWKGWVRAALAAAAVFFLLDLLLVNFRTAWIVLLGSSVVLLGLLLIEISKYRNVEMSSGEKPRFGWRQGAALGLIVLSIVMIMVRGPLIRLVELPAEVSPSFGATFSIAGAVFREGPLRVFFGSGPGTFGLDWARYKDPSINQTIFWGIRFNQGQSWAATLLPTAGVLGLIAFLGFLGMTLFTFLRMMLRSQPLSAGERLPAGDPDPLAAGVFLGFASLLVSAFLYPANMSLALLLFLAMGILSSLLAMREPVPLEEAPADGRSSVTGNQPPVTDFWSIRERVIRFETPWVVFVSSLAIIFFLALGVITLYGQANRARAALAANRGVAALNAGNIDEAVTRMEQAVRIEPRNFRNLQALVQLRTEKARRLIQKAAGGENVQQEFQSAVSLAIQSSQQLVQQAPYESGVWRLQGALYEMIIPFVQGSERFATAAYQRATDLEPGNPAIYVDWGRAGLVFTDRIMLVANQAQGKDKEELAAARAQNLEQIVQIFQRAIQAKPDFAAAHFLLAQTAIRLGNIDAAIQSVENAKLAAPFDIGVAFQLGLLYYQKDSLPRAAQEFERAVSIDENYSNARYFLGLIYDRQGARDKALAEFERIEKLNPDNPEVRRIIANLKAGKAALEGIVPPAPPPEKRKEAPVREEERKQ